MANEAALWRPLLYVVAVLVVVAALPLLGWLLGQRHRERVTGEPYESGIAPTGSPHGPVNVGFYLVGLLFVIFDLEAAFLFAWAVAARRVGWRGYAGVLVFVAVLVVGLIYEWRQGALDFAPPGRRLPRLAAGTGALRTSAAGPAESLQE